MKTVHSWNWIGAVCTACLLLAATAKSDTYNFYFSKPKAKAGSNASLGAEADAEAPVDKSEAPPPAPSVPAAAEAPPAAPATPIVVSGGGNGQPVIINNTNNITIPTAAPAERAIAPREKPSAPVLLSPSESSVTATLSAVSPSEGRPRWKFGLGMLHSLTTTRLEGRGAETGGVVSLGVDFTHWLGINLYGGGLVYDSGSPETAFYGGADLEIHPFHITIGHLDVLELGFLAGGSTARAAYDNWGSFHLGGRATLSFDQQFGITVATRANFGTVLFEGGLVTRF